MVLLAAKLVFKKDLKTIAQPSYWWSASAKLDYQLVIVNQLIMLLLKPFMLGKLVVVTAIYYAMTDWFMPISVVWSGASWAIPLAYSLVLFIINDASRYWLHCLMHRVGLSSITPFSRDVHAFYRIAFPSFGSLIVWLALGAGTRCGDGGVCVPIWLASESLANTRCQWIYLCL